MDKSLQDVIRQRFRLAYGDFHRCNMRPKVKPGELCDECEQTIAAHLSAIAAIGQAPDDCEVSPHQVKQIKAKEKKALPVPQASDSFVARTLMIDKLRLVKSLYGLDCVRTIVRRANVDRAMDIPTDKIIEVTAEANRMLQADGDEV